MCYSVELWVWSERGALPPDFLDYPAPVVDEVRYLQSLANEVREDVARRNKKMEEMHKAQAGR